ncbi:large-conductance mechanosensitive channel [Cytobacillus purgationiresistens]|uniref:Large-conductance mechanosensitive channel n=2 Tax=Cytobacillus purgationiresistens TaxID=863449 RepID=A0ABU0AAL8_9BACI|nr:large-conductance mechanosensitive channel [Cytobacillus purgationiresistens]
MGDIIFQILMFLILFGFIYFIVQIIRILRSKRNDNKVVEEKLDKVIELLEEQKRK